MKKNKEELPKNVQEDLEYFEDPNVVGTFVRDGTRYVLVKHELPMAEARKYEEQGIKVLVTGEFKPLLKEGETFPFERTGRYRPILGGISVGHYNITAGTLGIILKDRDGDNVILSNNHVLASSSSVRKQRANVNDDILQPGRYDGGLRPQDRVAGLKRWIPIDETGVNYVDAAIAKIDPGIQFKYEILGLTYPKGFGTAKVNEFVKKSGRTTEVTNGPVYTDNATITINYGEFIATFTDIYLVINPFGAPGDSGSAVLNDKDELVGLLFAGSLSHTAVCKIQKIVDEFGLKLPGGETPPQPPTPPEGKKYAGKIKMTGKGVGYATVGDYKIPIQLDLTLEGTEEGSVED
jgi:V8-like Glu-specific endopeptidase